MINFFISYFALNFVRKNLNADQLLPQYKKAISTVNYFVIPIVLAFSFATKDKFEFALAAIWTVVFYFVLYILWQLRENNLARGLFRAILPFAIISSLRDLLGSFNIPVYNEYDSIIDFIYLGSIVWTVAFWISTNNQQKALKKEEEKNIKIVSENEKLEVLVNERTKEIQSQKSQLEETIEELKATQNQLVQQEKLASLGELTAGIAHEIQNPLNFVNNFSEVSVELVDELKIELDKSDFNAEVGKELLNDLVQNLEKITHHGKRASGIVKNMLEHSRSNSGEKQSVDINDLADEYIRLSYHGLRAKDKTFNSDFKVELDPAIPKVDLVPQDIGRVLLNLLNNAFFAVKKKSQNLPEGQEYKPMVQLITKNYNNTTEPYIEIIIKDNGVGIPQSMMKKIFQPFFTTKPTGEGTGLGLSLSYDIITKGNQGSLELESKEGEGTSFIVKIPY